MSWISVNVLRYSSTSTSIYCIKLLVCGRKCKTDWD